MSKTVITAIYYAVIVGLFYLDRRPRERTGAGLWVAFAWLFFVLSKSPAAWMQSGPTEYGGSYNLESNPLNLVLYSAIIVCGVIVLAARPNRVGKCLRANWPILLFYGYCLLSCVWSDYTLEVSKKWVRCLGDPITILIILTEIEPATALKRLYARLGFVLLPLSVLYIKYYPEIGRAYSNSWEYMFRGVCDHKNTLGAVCCMLGLGFLWRFLDHWQNKAAPRSRRYLLADGTMLVTTVWLLWTADSATSKVCFVTGALTLLACRVAMVRRRRWALHLIVLALVSVPIYAAYFDRQLVANVGRNPTLTGRTDLWQQCLQIAGNPLVGTGFESFWLGWRIQRIWDENIGIRLNEAHNGYLEVYLQLGWCGVALLAVVLAATYPKLVRGLRSDFSLPGLMLAYLIAALNFNHSESDFRVQYSVWVFLLLAIMAAPSWAKTAGTRLRDEIGIEDKAFAASDRGNFWGDTSRSDWVESAAPSVGEAICLVKERKPGLGEMTVSQLWTKRQNRQALP
jgi:exopolysaccharide production protein ExoQ